jgi:hypothetical protein
MAHLVKITSAFELSALTLTAPEFKFKITSSKSIVLLNSWAIFILFNCSLYVLACPALD